MAPRGPAWGEVQALGARRTGVKDVGEQRPRRGDERVSPDPGQPFVTGAWGARGRRKVVHSVPTVAPGCSEVEQMHLQMGAPGRVARRVRLFSHWGEGFLMRQEPHFSPWST